MSTGVTEQRVVRELPIRTLAIDVLEGVDAGATLSAQESISVGTAPNNVLVLKDTTVSRYHLDLSAHRYGVLVVDHGSTNGTLTGQVRIDRAVVPPGALLKLGATTLRVRDSESSVVALHGGDSLAGLRGRSVAMRRLMAQIERASNNDAPVLLLGESGTGKEVIARALHSLGRRASKPIITVDCASLAPALVASELFGHERGAFTGADRQHIGAFERADGGTVFLDEIGELPAPLQPALLGVLERKRFRRVGGRNEISVDVRVVAATHRDLRGEVNAGTFRLDLYYRLAVVLLAIPPLRERTEDIALLAEHFLREAGLEGPIEDLIGEAAMRSLAAHHWPGNVRELRNLLEATVAMGESQIASLQSAAPSPPAVGAQGFGPLLDQSYKEARAALLHAFESAYLDKLMTGASGNVSKAARQAKMDRSYLIDLLHRHGKQS